MLRLLRPSICQNQWLSAFGVPGRCDSNRSMSPSGCSTLITSAPKSPSIMAAAGAAMTVAASMTFRPENRCLLEVAGAAGLAFS